MAGGTKSPVWVEAIIFAPSKYRRARAIFALCSFSSEPELVALLEPPCLRNHSMVSIVSRKSSPSSLGFRV
jgi:hypothetical protein